MKHRPFVALAAAILRLSSKKAACAFRPRSRARVLLHRHALPIGSVEGHLPLAVAHAGQLACMTNSSRSVMVSRRLGSGRGLVHSSIDADWSGGGPALAASPPGATPGRAPSRRSGPRAAVADLLEVSALTTIPSARPVLRRGLRMLASASNMAGCSSREIVSLIRTDPSFRAAVTGSPPTPTPRWSRCHRPL